MKTKKHRTIIDGIPQPHWVIKKLNKMTETGKYEVVFWESPWAGCIPPMPNSRSEDKIMITAWILKELQAELAAEAESRGITGTALYIELLSRGRIPAVTSKPETQAQEIIVMRLPKNIQQALQAQANELGVELHDLCVQRATQGIISAKQKPKS